MFKKLLRFWAAIESPISYYSSKKFQLLFFIYFLENGLSQLTLASYGGYYFYL